MLSKVKPFGSIRNSNVHVVFEILIIVISCRKDNPHKAGLRKWQSRFCTIIELHHKNLVVKSNHFASCPKTYEVNQLGTSYKRKKIIFVQKNHTIALIAVFPTTSPRCYFFNISFKELSSCFVFFRGILIFVC